MPAYITQISTALPEFRYRMEEIVLYLAFTAASEEAARKAKIVAQKSGIRHRYAVINDFRDSTTPRLFHKRIPQVEERMRIFHQEALPLALKAVNQLDFIAEEITHIIAVSCTGMSAPGLEIQIAKALDLSTNCAKYAVNFMGCHGAFHALKLAHAFAQQDPSHQILIISVELCSLHYQPSDDDDSILANVLFGDGAAACIVSSQTTKDRSIQINGFDQILLPDKEDLMAWNIHSSGFLLKLSSYVPKAINEGMPYIIDKDEAMPEHWAVHPGGKSILQTITDRLELPLDALAISHQILENIGNLSSATILFVLKQQLASSDTGSLLALGFGPGLSVEKMHAELISS